MEAEADDKTTSWLKKTFRSANVGELQGAESLRKHNWHSRAQLSFKSFRSDFDIRSRAETVVQALSTRRVYLMRYVRAAISVLNVRTLFMCALACAIVYLCESGHLDLRFRQDFSIISVGTIFPLVFAIQQAFMRREEALKEMAFLKAQLMGIYFCNRDWDISDGLLIRANLGNDSSEHALRCQQLILKFLNTLKQWLLSRTVYESESERRSLQARGWLPSFVRGEGQAMNLSLDLSKCASFTQRVTDSERAVTQKQLYYQCYHYLSQLNVLNETLTAKANYPKAGEGGMSRLAQYIAKSTEALEKLRYLREYRTPFMLRYVSLILILVSLFLMSPYFAFMCVDSKWQQDTSGSCPAGYVMACLYVVVVCTLYGVQVALENPFDGEGMDDVYFDLPREFEETMQRYGRSGNFHKASAGTIVGNSVYVLGSSGIPPTGYSNYPGGLTVGIGGGGGGVNGSIQRSSGQPSALGGTAAMAASAGGGEHPPPQHVTFAPCGGTGSGGGASHAMGQAAPSALLPARPSADPLPPPTWAPAQLAVPQQQQAAPVLRRNFTMSLSQRASAHSTPAAASHQQPLPPPQQHVSGGQGGGMARSSGTFGGAGNSTWLAAAAAASATTDVSSPNPNVMAVETKGQATASSSSMQGSCTGVSRLSGIGGGGGAAEAAGSSYPAAALPSPGAAAVSPSLLMASEAFNSKQEQQQLASAPPPMFSVQPNGNPGPGFIAAMPAGGTAHATAANSDIGGAVVVGAAPPDATPAAVGPIAVAALAAPLGAIAASGLDSPPAEERHQPAAAAATAAAIMARISGGGSRGGGSTPPFQRPSLGVPVGAATVGLTDPHTLLVAGGSGPGIAGGVSSVAMRHLLEGGSPVAFSAAVSGAGGRSTPGHYRMQQHSTHSTRALLGIGSNAGRPQLLAGGSPTSTVPGTPFMPGSHRTSRSGIFGGSNTSLGGAVLLAMDHESGAVGRVLVPSMPRGDAESPTAQDAIEADLARGMFGHLHVASLPLGHSSHNSQQPSPSLLHDEGAFTPAEQQSPPR
ncbi:hypothetical protein HXX76_007468 [Chlamydomonas incerta]|uniref:Uncharacterized protein n=1 Tax=Chlamydomonas incerta TaxID=51695 RepID=A0A835TBZ6_CHLIN|nr:hypothetical protein HXX76_007468 [Chlamydomonas incerta]|eukprot:KAG2435396.1 hypothetical protein HXX76_007468 [Chlamydomonas incerta]